MTLKEITVAVLPAEGWKSRLFVGGLAALALVFVALFYDYAAENRMMLTYYYIGITGAAYVLVRRRATILMELVIFAAVARTVAGVYFSALPGFTDPILVVLGDLAFWFVLFYLGWRLAAEAYRLQKNEIREVVAREVDEQTTSARGKALVATSREIRQPLATMRTIADALLNQPPEAMDEAQQDSLADMDRSINHLMILVNNLLDYGQVEADMIQLHREPVTLPDLINQCVGTLRTKAAASSVEIQTHIDPNVTEVTADPLRLKQILFTLLSNAVDLNNEGGIVNVQVRALEEEIVLSVRDTGKGISDEEMQALFDPYLETTEKNHHIHASLGLSLAKRLVEMHAGSLTVASAADSGNVFTVRLPLGNAPVPADQKPAALSSSDVERVEESSAAFNPSTASLSQGRASAVGKQGHGSKRVKPLEAEENEADETTRVLVADANPSVRRILKQWLASLDCEMIETDNGEEAMRLAHGRPTPHVILLDAQLPGMNGFEVCHALKSDSRLQLIPVILSTSVDSVEEKVHAFDAGADDFLIKPINRAELTVRLRSLLRIYKFNQELIGAESVAMALARAVAAKDGYSQGHVGRVANYAILLGEKLGLDVAELKILKYGAILHNVGKIAIPDAILEKTGALSPRELAMFHRHPQIGCDICTPLKPLQPVLTVIRHHKERWDGSGYPDRLVGDEIPLSAQIIGVVDAYTALISNRPWRKAMLHEKAVDVLRQQAEEGWYNPELVEKFVDCLEHLGEDQTEADEPAEIAVEMEVG